MRPIKLEINAFGPYKDLTIIDFDKMGDKGLFLLTGDTGSGKTMIFDALTFALFGQGSGNERHMTSFRSHHANPFEETYVSLVFSHKGKEYNIKRIPTQSYIKRKGKEATQTLHQVELTLPNGEHITSVMGGNEKIQEILGLDYQQFTQVALIGQGEFRKLLNTDSKERSKIFRKIFNTGFYDKFQDKLGRLNSTHRKEYELVQTKIKTVFEDLDIDEVKFESLDKTLDELEKDLIINQKEYTKLDNKYKNLQEKRIKENKILDKQNDLIKEFKILEELKEKLIKLNLQEKEIKTLEENLVKLNNALIHIKPTFTSLNTLKLKVKNDKKRYAELNKELKENEKGLKKALYEELSLNQKKSQIDFTKAEIHTLKESLAQYEVLNSYQTKISILLNSLKENNESLSKTKKLIETTKSNISNYKNDLKTKSIKENELIKAKESFKNLTELIELDKLIKSLDSELTIKEKELLKFQDKVSDKRIELNDAEHLFFTSQAGLLAQDLKDEEPCPVCGSTHHPNIAKLSDETISKETIDTLKSKLAALEKSRDNLSQKLNLIKGRLTENKDQFNQKRQDNKDIYKNYEITLKEKDALEKTLTKLENIESNLKKQEELLESNTETEKILTDSIHNLNLEHKEINTRYEELNKTLKYDSLDKAQNHLNNLSTKIEQFNAAFDKNQLLIKELNSSKDTLTTRIEDLKKSLNKDEKMIKDHSNHFKQALKEYGFENELAFEEILEIEKNKDSLQNKVTQFKETLITENTRKETLEKRLKDKEYPDTSKQLNLLEELENTINTHSDNMRILSSKLENLSSNLKRLREYEKELVEARIKYQEINNLYQTASGGLSGKDRITFEFYVQTAYFTKVIHEANKRLSIMTQGRYALKLREEASDKRNVSGLDLDVIDFHTNRTREVSTLSGGESFKAALSLALGMSDVIQIFAGGIEIDMLFVDEGFGSLDQESLDQAIEVLNELSSDHRLIGIISHVSELKGRIDKQIVVHKDITGSHVEMIV